MLVRQDQTVHDACRSQEDFFIFLLCLEKTAFSSTDDEVLETCSSHAKLDEKSLRQCMDGKLGKSPMSPLTRCELVCGQIVLCTHLCCKELSAHSYKA